MLVNVQSRNSVTVLYRFRSNITTPVRKKQSSKLARRHGEDKHPRVYLVLTLKSDWFKGDQDNNSKRLHPRNPLKHKSSVNFWKEWFAIQNFISISVRVSPGCTHV